MKIANKGFFNKILQDWEILAFKQNLQYTFYNFRNLD